MIKIFKEACGDIAKALRLHRVWIALAQEDVGDSHRRTTLGPAWLLINYLVLTATFIIVFGGHMGISNYAAFAAIGLFVFNYINETITLGTTLFLRDQSFIKGSVLPLSTYVLRQSSQSIIRSSYALLGCLLVMLLSGVDFTIGWLYATLGLILVLLTTPAVIVVCAILGAAFPDVQFIVNNVLRVLMFATPVFWAKPQGSPLREALYRYNPLTYFIDIVRAPVLEFTFPQHSFAVALAISILMWITALYMLGRYRKQIVFML